MTDEPIRVAVLGARGRMGALVCPAVEAADDMDLVAMVDIGDWLFNVADAGAQVVVDFTHPEVVLDNIRFCLDNDIPCVVGTSGFDAEQLDTVRRVAGAQARARGADRPELRDRRGAGDALRRDRRAVLRLRRGHRAAPRGQGRRAVRDRGAHRPLIAAGARRGRRGPVPDATTQELDGARGADVDGIRVHSVRLPGLVAHQEVLFGTAGETLTIRHDSLDRDSFMPGVLLAVRAVLDRPGLTVGLEPLLGLG